MTGSDVRPSARVTTTPMTAPTARPPTATTTKSSPATPIENATGPIAATAARYAMSADASLMRLSPSRIVTIRRETPSRWKTAVAATASGGATMAPSANAAASGMPVSCCVTNATATVVNSTSPMASNRIGRADSP